MKFNKLLISFLSITCLAFSSCNDWNEPKQEEIDHIGGNNTISPEKRDAYYASLREWKKSAENYQRPVSFGWFSNWAPSGAIRKGYLAALPDSIDMISMWSGPFNISKEKIADKEYVQKVKGTKVFVCYILHNIGTGITPSSVEEKVRKDNPNLSESDINDKIKKATEEYWGYTSGVQGSPDHIKAIQKYAKVLYDSIEKYNYDGLDIDWEPMGAGDGFGNLKSYNNEPGKYLHILVEELGKYMGPKSGKDNHKLLIVDGELGNVSKESAPYFDYFIEQAYGSYVGELNYRSNRLKKHFGEYYSTKKHIFTENFESYSQSGGSLLTQAKWNPSSGPKGGVGAYRLDNDYDNSPDYKWMRKAIYYMLKSFEEFNKNNP
ncbi:glycoside hydrolase family 18 [Ornithobacterium rhinotracheale]|uniref:glycoside hydrolase family 18 n=1 Tax=Ornithobacterium rhinotracheale TaxID=28251 RepID=UPI00129CF078|nr:glycoside hydrolase family 18 [Ornithobacterium rhinotracheale]MRI64634.1 glycoside hydrolase family 18 [Ornithobacterium rhinotracheale]